MRKRQISCPAHNRAVHLWKNLVVCGARKCELFYEIIKSCLKFRHIKLKSNKKPRHGQTTPGRNLFPKEKTNYLAMVILVKSATAAVQAASSFLVIASVILAV